MNSVEVEELRRDSQDVRNRVDLEALEMSGMPDHEKVLSAIQEINGSEPNAGDQGRNGVTGMTGCAPAASGASSGPCVT
jgi:hypothetical protein